MRSVERQPVVGVGEFDARGAQLVGQLAVAGDGVRQVDDVHDLGAAEASAAFWALIAGLLVRFVLRLGRGSAA